MPRFGRPGRVGMGGFRRVRVATRRILILAVVVNRQKNKVQVSQDNGTVVEKDLIKYKDGTEGFELEGSYYDTNKILRNPEDLMI